MRKLLLIFLFSITAVAFGQAKYALIIGNSNYTNFGTLRNPVNDANDMAAALANLGFTVDKVINGSLNQMENASIRLKERLISAGNDAYGFFYYAGHGLEMGGVNYLIPTDADIPDRSFLRERAFSVQIMLDMLNDTRDALNIVVLDACRDFPATWSRSLDRGLTFITNPPANHIIMYATGAGMVASDGNNSRNGLFTSYLLHNLQQPGIDVNEVFRQTMGDVANATNNAQRPALYTDFAKTVYLGSKPIAEKPAPVPQPQELATPVRSVQNQPAAKLEIGKVDWFLPRTADIRKNWLSLDIGGIGPRYERMLGHKISLGTFAYWVFPMDMSYNCFGADASFNFYPWGKTFYLGTSLGFFYRTYSSDEYNDDFGLSITPEIGWKIDIGKPGGFYMKPGFAVTFFVPGGDLIPYLIRLNWGIGYAF